MRFKSSAKSGKSLAKLAVTALLAGAATGCSSDATRFTGFFEPDNLTTSSVPPRAVGRSPMPRADLGYGHQAQLPPPVQPAPSRNYAYSGPDQYGSSARAASAPTRVERYELSAPQPVREPANRQEALAQPFPARQAGAGADISQNGAVNRADSLVTGTTRSASGWSTVNAPSVTLRPGETASTLARRYGVPEKEILRANGGSLTAGQRVLIPTFGPVRNAARSAADSSLPANAPSVPVQEQKVATLPAPARDKAVAAAPRATPPQGGGKPVGGSYTVKPGDTLTKIARETGTPIDSLKAANGLSDSSIRIGQVLKVGSGVGNGRGTDAVTTAGIPQRQPARATAQAEAPRQQQAQSETRQQAPARNDERQVAALQKPAATGASVSEVEKRSAGGEAAPASSQIGKYRWPVNGAVVAGFGQNVNGSRNDGIDISVPEGTPVKAAENGVVIYAGNGLKQLGNTVLLRHDDGKVTVYGHAANLNVTRGQKVTRGQTIATSGMSGDAKRPQLHFEVRKNASPVNPASYLE